MTVRVQEPGQPSQQCRTHAPAALGGGAGCTSRGAGVSCPHQWGSCDRAGCVDTGLAWEGRAGNIVCTSHVVWQRHTEGRKQVGWHRRERHPATPHLVKLGTESTVPSQPARTCSPPAQEGSQAIPDDTVLTHRLPTFYLRAVSSAPAAGGGGELRAAAECCVLPMHSSAHSLPHFLLLTQDCVSVFSHKDPMACDTEFA